MASSLCNVLKFRCYFFVRLYSLNLCSHATDFEFNSLKFISSKPKYTAQLESDVESQFDAKTIKHKKHPGKRISRCISLPDELVAAVNRVVTRYPRKFLNKEAESLYRYLHSRRLPIEKQEMKIKSQNSAEKLQSLDEYQLAELSEEDKIKLVNSRNSKITNYLKSEVNRWQPIDYDAHISMVYLLARLAPNYSILIWVFSEITQAIPNFTPKSLFDFGSGVGSTMWAANSIWSKQIKEFFCVDASAQMNELAQNLLQSTETDEKLFHRGIFFRQFLPSSSALKYDLVVSAHSLLELPSAEDRLRVIDSLWRKTQGILVIIENGTKAGSSAVLEARDYILHLKNSKTDTIKNDVNGAYIVGPCPHAMACPRFIDELKSPCCFEVRYNSLLLNERTITSKKETFSYVILSRGEKPKGIDSWPRIVSPVLKRSKHTICRMCNKDGELREIIFTKSKHGSNAYKCAKQSAWGDLFPGVLSPCSNSVADCPSIESDDFENYKENSTNS